MNMMDKDEHVEWLAHVMEVTAQACIDCSTYGEDAFIVMPTHIWAGGECKVPAVVRARTLTAIELQRTVGRKVAEPRTKKEQRTKTPERRWRIYPEGFPADGEYEPMSTPLLVEWCGGKCHSTFVRIFERERARLVKGREATSQVRPRPVSHAGAVTAGFLD